MRDYNGVVTFDPRLPDSWERLTFQITLRGTRVQVDLTAGQIAFSVVAGEQVEVSVRGHRVKVSAASPVRIPLSDQGPGSTGPRRRSTRIDGPTAP